METKFCPGCEEVKPTEAFNYKNKQKGLLQVRCRACTRLQVRTHYENNRPYYIDKAQKRNKTVIAEQRQKIYDYLLTHACVDCGEKDPVCLEFDHIKGIKTKAISEMIGVYAWDAIEYEISKCEIRCANCHRRKTAKQFGYWKA
jgi:hypothetical protein